MCLLAQRLVQYLDHQHSLVPVLSHWYIYGGVKLTHPCWFSLLQSPFWKHLFCYNDEEHDIIHNMIIKVIIVNHDLNHILLCLMGKKQ